ncbi:MAG TPA: hypothetical protein VMY79_02890 [Dehalococcoidia bacterium]|nr:hypothetical protein [Dehalococcoidia bacterium]
MRQIEYRECLRPYITGSKTKEQRQLDFCTGAKVCSRGISVEEAKRICSLPKEPKLPGRKHNGKTCEKETLELTKCIIGRIDMNLASNNIELAVRNAIMGCRCGKDTQNN